MTGFGDLNMKFPLLLAISVFMSSLNILLYSRVEHEKFYKLGTRTSWSTVTSISYCGNINYSTTSL